MLLNIIYMSNFQRALAVVVFFIIVIVFNLGTFYGIQYLHESVTEIESDNWLYQIKNSICESQIKELKSQEVECNKANELRQIAIEVGVRPYVYGVYDCFGHSVDLAKDSRDIEVETVIFEGTMNGCHHFWVGVMMEATSGRFIRPTDKYTIMEIRNSKNETILDGCEDLLDFSDDIL